MEDEFSNRVKKQLIKLIQEKNMTIYKLASLSDVSDASIRNWFNNKNCSPSLDSLGRVCEVLGVSLSQFFLFEENSHNCNLDDELKNLIDTYLILDNNKKQAVLNLIALLKN